MIIGSILLAKAKKALPATSTAVAKAPPIDFAALFEPDISVLNCSNTPLMASFSPLSPMVRATFAIASSMFDIVPPMVFICSAIAPPKLMFPIERKYRSISVAFLATSVVTPWKMNLTVSPSTLALIPKVFSLSNSPTVADVTAETNSKMFLPKADAVLP